MLWADDGRADGWALGALGSGLRGGQQSVCARARPPPVSPAASTRGGSSGSSAFTITHDTSTGIGGVNTLVNPAHRPVYGGGTIRAMNIINEIPIGPEGPVATDDWTIQFEKLEVRVYNQDDTARIVPRWYHSFDGRGSQVYKPAEGDAHEYAVVVNSRQKWTKGSITQKVEEERKLEFLRDGGQSISLRNVPLPGSWTPRLDVTGALDGGPPLFAGGGTLYRINDKGNLLLYQHDARGEFVDYNGREIGWSWGGMLHIMAVRDGGLYAVDADRRLRYYHHDAAGKWDDVNGRVIGEGWGFPWVGAGRFGQLYVKTSASQLLYYEHDGSFQFGSRSGRMLNEGWPERGMFGGGTNCIYFVQTNGDLLHYYHHDSLAWAHQQLKIGQGWGGFTHVRSAGAGEIYAVTPGGDLLFYRHDAFHKFVAGSGKTIGSGWASASPHGIIPSAR